MTINRFHEKARIARKYGEAKLDNGSTLWWTGREWIYKGSNGQVVDTAYDIKALEYLA